MVTLSSNINERRMPFWRKRLPFINRARVVAWPATMKNLRVVTQYISVLRRQVVAIWHIQLNNG